MSTSPGTGLVGTVLGGAYRITRLIGQGGMGAVYEGVQLRLERRVAVKLMARELSANPEAIARFRREAEVTSQLGHPHIVQVFDFGSAPTGEPYLVMEYLEGEDLEKRIARVGRMSAPAASHIIRQVASALSATHAKGIVHRDLKPANVFLLSVEGETDFVKVVDFGISKVRAAGTKLTAALAVMGTPNYMAPEQAEGRIDEIDHRTDQWALACIAYELLAGRPPFIGENVASLLYQVIHQAPSPLASMNPGLPGQVEDVLRRALSKTQVGRFSTMTEFSRAFEGAASGKALPPSAAVPAAVAGTAPAPAAPANPGIAPATTFSSTAGEALAAGATLQGRPKRRGLLIGVSIAAAAAAGAGAFAFISRPATVSTTAAPPSPDAGAMQAAATPGAAPSGPAKKSKRPRPAWPPTPGSRPSQPSGPVGAAEPPPQADWPAREAPPQQPAGAWPPPQQQQAAPAPSWPPQPQQAAPQPAWPPPPDATPQQPKRRRSLFRRIIE